MLHPTFRLPKLVESHPVHLDHSLLTFSSPVPFCRHLGKSRNDEEDIPAAV
jgi:hypothetical protein